MGNQTLIFIDGIEKLRLARGMTQKELVQDIISPATYSRVKNGETRLTIQTIEKLAGRLQARIEDIIDYSKYNDDIETLSLIHEYDYIIEHKQTIEIARADKLYLTLTNRENLSISLARFKYLLQKHFSEQSTIIPKVDPSYINSGYNRIIHSSKLTSYDLEFLGDFTSFLSLEQLKNLYPKIAELDINVRKFHNSYFHKYTGICFVNFADTFIDNSEFEMAGVLLENIEKYATTFGHASFHIWYKYLFSVMEIYKEKEPEEKKKKLDELGKYIDGLKVVLDHTRTYPFFRSTYQRLVDRNGNQPTVHKVHYLLKG
ncbi:helix-turn-helix domain-containing protein [Enterococcus faecium]|uniref:helix-turn-helix domain-containing protein n=1 Tax=Enterococcus faecium TaxID=1352 RepID=UPI000BF0BCB7|nr:helix-turn-helix transcriptional regulator [Enterococcus faecium]PEH49617.1 hypothetical protein CRM75_01150 [Enterococcus faecium]